MRDSGVFEQVVIGPKPIRVYRKRKKSSYGSSQGACVGVAVTTFIPLHTLAKMASSGEKCGLSSLLPMYCRDRAEAFAKSLHTRMKNLGAQNNNNNTDESSWLAAHENPIATSQPRHMLDFCLLEPTGSPEDPEAELEVEEINRLINADGLSDSGNDDCHKSCLRNLKCSSDSDSDVFYDIENDLEQENRLENRNSEEENAVELQCCQGDVTNGTNSEARKNQLEEPYTTKQLNGTDQAVHETTPGLNGTMQDVNGTAGEEGGGAGGGGENESSDRTDGTTDEVTQRLNGTSTQEEYHSLTSNFSDDLSDLSLRDEDCISDRIVVANENPCDNEAQQSEELPVSNLKVDEEKLVECSESPTHQESTVEISVNGSLAKEEDKDSSEEDDDRIPHIRRCSSLKTGKTPPGTPGRKKIVRFADALGLDLTDVRTFLDEIPKVPTSAYEDLSVDITDSPSDTSLDSKSTCPKPDKVLMPLFQQPGSLPNFLDLVRDNYVCLENAIIDDPFLLTIKGFVRVRNLDFHKSVYVRYTLNSWKTYADVQATYLENSCDGFSDKFSFVIYAHSLSVGQRLELACRFQCKGCQYWDNNNGRNYCLQCLPVINHTAMTPIITGMDWGTTASFYYQDSGIADETLPIEPRTPQLTTTDIQDYILSCLPVQDVNAKQYNKKTDFVVNVSLVNFDETSVSGIIIYNLITSQASKALSSLNVLTSKQYKYEIIKSEYRKGSFRSKMKDIKFHFYTLALYVLLVGLLRVK